MNNKKNIVETPPIAFIIFNRPDYAQNIFNEIKRAQPKQLFVIADGPRNPEEIFLCKKTREIINQVDWECKVYKNYADINLGLKKRISSGISWFFENVEMGIILEDDCLPHPSFFRFAGEILEKYKYDEKIMMISGNNFLSNFEHDESYIFSRSFPIWGWATWRRSWRKYDIDMKNFEISKTKKKLENIYKQKYIIKHILKLFRNISSGEINTWDIQWLYTCLMNNALCIIPKKNLISNIGIDGTHQGGNNQNLPTYDLYTTGNLRHPKTKIVNTNYDNTFYKKNFSPEQFSPKKWVISILVKYKGIKNSYHFLKNILLKIHNIFPRTPKIIQIYINKIINKLYGIVHMPAKGKLKGYVLLSYITSPFTFNPWEYPTDPHTNYWECSEIARLFSIRGYAVDVIDANNKTFKPHRKYKAVIDIKNNLKKLSPVLSSSCKKVMHITSSFGKYQNEQETKRLNNLNNRRDTSFTPQRLEEESDNPVYADFLEGFGNKTVHNTYSQFNKPIYPIPISVAQTFDFPQQKDFSETRTHFLFFGGGGAILKGLDLVVEAFSVLPNLHLHIIGPASYEKEFSEEYKKELNLPNIHRYQRPKISKDGIMTVSEKLFSEIANQCAFIIYPSASEGTSGAVIQAMHTGIIPVVTKETGLSENSPSIIIEDQSVDSIILLLQKISKTNPKDLYKTAYDSWKYANKHHTKETFSKAYTNFIDNILKI